jgi:3-dehydroquinate dehydratase
MECAICFEKFFTPKTKEELEKIYNENVKNNTYDEIINFENLLITSKHNTTHTCPTSNCQCIICKAKSFSKKEIVFAIMIW